MCYKPTLLHPQFLASSRATSFAYQNFKDDCRFYLSIGAQCMSNQRGRNERSETVTSERCSQMGTFFLYRLCQFTLIRSFCLVLHTS